MTARGVIFDLVAAQSPSYRGRGIARYSTDLVRAMVRGHPELVSSIVLHPELPIPDGLDDLREWLTTEPDWSSGTVLHLSSVIEPEVPVRTFWPREASAQRLVTAATVYDLIPDLFPGWYLEDPGLRRRWRCCRETVRAVDVVLTLSEASRQDTVTMLGVPEDRVVVIGSGTSPTFRRPEPGSRPLTVARRGVKGLKKGFIIYVGAFNPRKNVDRLVEGYSRMPKALIERHQLVIVCEAPPLTRNHYLVMAKDLGIEGRLLIPGFVPEEVLVALYQSAELAVFPSLYEGYGLPVIESLACGTPSLAGDNSSLKEILPREARFQPEDPDAIGEAITRALTDHVFRERLLELTNQSPPSWAAVAERAAEVFGAMLLRAQESPPGWRSRPQLALVDPPARLAGALAPWADCDTFRSPADGAEHSADEHSAPEHSAKGLSWSALAHLDPWRGGYDAVVGWAGGLDDRGPALSELATEWRGRAIVVVGEEAAGPQLTAISRLERSGLRVVRWAKDGDWEATARLVVEAVRGAGV